MTTETLRQRLVAAIEAAGSYAVGDQPAPAAILWPDGQRLWEQVVPSLRPELNVITYGDYVELSAQGPSYWIRCALARTIHLDLAGDGSTPIIYLPGVSREDLGAGEDSPEAIRPLIELQYRGAFWAQPNNRDWTPTAFLMNRDHGLGITVRQDDATQKALTVSLEIALDQSVEWFLA